MGKPRFSFYLTLAGWLGLVDKDIQDTESSSEPAAQASIKTSTYLDDVQKSSNEIVYLEYTPDQLPPKPSDGWTRFVCISDTHSRTFEVPDGDVLLHSGDLTNTGTVKEFEKTMRWLYSLPHKTKIIIAGNHDLTLHSEQYDRIHTQYHRTVGKQKIELVTKMLKGSRARRAGIVYLQDEKHEFRVKKNGRLWSVYGSPWSLEVIHGAFGYAQEDGPALVSNFPKTDILLTHGPPYQIFDQVISGLEVGCEALRARLSELRPRLHLFGHIHESHGAHIHTWDPASNNAPPILGTDSTIKFSNQPWVSESPGFTEPSDTSLDKTVFVNAANWPMGTNALRGGVWSHFGGPGFQAVVVDLKD